MFKVFSIGGLSSGQVTGIDGKFLDYYLGIYLYSSTPAEWYQYVCKGKMVRQKKRDTDQAITV